MRRVRCRLDEAALTAYVTGQLNAFFPDDRMVGPDSFRGLLPDLLDRIEHCFTRINNKYFQDADGALFDPLHGDQYAMFLYLAANAAYRAGAGDGLPSKLFLLNKALHGIEVFYEVELPSIFLFVHPLGTVLGRGRYSDHLLVYQRCGVGSNHECYPELGPYLTLRPGSSVLGKCRVGRNCTIAADSLLLDQDLPDQTVYIGNPRDHVTRPADSVVPIWRLPTSPASPSLR